MQLLWNQGANGIIQHKVPPGGHSHWKGVWGCAAVMTPFFQASRRSLAHQFTLNAPLLCPLFSIFRKFLHFQPCFGQNSSSLDPSFSKFSFSRPPFFQENPLPRPYIFKPAWHTPTKKKVECPPPPPPESTPYWLTGKKRICHFLSSVCNKVMWQIAGVDKSYCNHYGITLNSTIFSKAFWVQM